MIEVTGLPINLKELSVGPEYRGKGRRNRGGGDHLPLRIFADLLTLFQSGGHHITTFPLPPRPSVGSVGMSGQVTLGYGFVGELFTL